MKNAFLSILLMFSFLGLHAQTGSTDLYVRVLNLQGQALDGLAVNLRVGDASYDQLTGDGGWVNIEAKPGDIVRLSFPSQVNFAEIRVPEPNRFTHAQAIRYEPSEEDWARSRERLQDTVWQDLPMTHEPGRGQNMLSMTVKGLGGRLLPGVEVRMRSLKTGQILATHTDSRGVARLVFPHDEPHSTAVGDMVKFSVLQVTAEAGFTVRTTADYLPEQLVHPAGRDTVWQNLRAETEPTSTYVPLRIQVQNLLGQALPNELVSLDVIGSEQLVYAARTNSSGLAFFSLPKNSRYSLNFEFDRELTFFDYPYIGTRQRQMVSLSYPGSEAIRAFMAVNNRDQNGFRKDFLESNVSNMIHDNSRNIIPIEKGYSIVFDNSDLTCGSLALQDGRLFGPGSFGGGYELYAYDLRDGKAVWGIELADNDPSAIVIAEGVLLAITESCTLYAIDIQTGRALWNAWLSGYMYTTPTVGEGMVFAAYPMDGKSGFALVAFGLRDGQVKWQAELDKDIMGAAVYADERVLVTDLFGKVYAFAAADGKLLASRAVGAVSPPTVVGQELHLSLRANASRDRQELAVLDVNTLAEQRRFPDVSGPFLDVPHRDLAFHEQMEYNGARPLHYLGMHFAVVGGRLLCYDPAGGKLIWQAEIPAARAAGRMLRLAATMPLVVANQIVVSTPGGAVLFFSPTDGRLIRTLETGEPLFGQPVFHKGWLYCGTRSGKILALDLGDSRLDGWRMWCGNPAHNPVYEARRK